MTPAELEEMALRAAELAEVSRRRALARSAELEAIAEEYLARVNYQKLGMIRRRWLRTWAERNPPRRPWDSWRCQPGPREVVIVAARWRSSDGKFRLAVADNRWHLDQAAAFAAAAALARRTPREDCEQ